MRRLKTVLASQRVKRGVHRHCCAARKPAAGFKQCPVAPFVNRRQRMVARPAAARLVIFCRNRRNRRTSQHWRGFRCYVSDCVSRNRRNIPAFKPRQQCIKRHDRPPTCRRESRTASPAVRRCVAPWPVRRWRLLAVRQLAVQGIQRPLEVEARQGFAQSVLVEQIDAPASIAAPLTRPVDSHRLIG